MGAINVPQSAGQGMPQLKRPHEEAPERKPAESKKKKVKGPRAVGILQISNGKATLIPVAILVEGKFYDASVYKAEPVPMALDGGTIYEAEEAGESQGLFTVAGALHSQSSASANPWMGTGSYYKNGTEAAKTTRKAEDVPAGMDSGGDEPPKLTRKSASNGSGSTAPTGDSGGGGKPSSEKSGANAPVGSGSAGESSGKGAGSASDKSADESGKKQTTGTGDTATGNGPVAQQSAGQVPKSDESSGAATPDGKGQGAKAQESENYYRPTLRRGKPTQAAPAEEETTAKVVATGLPTSAGVVASAKPVQVMAAISDGGGPQPESFKFFWKEGEEEERRKQMLMLAGSELRAYISARAKKTIGMTPASSGKTGVAKHKAEKPTEPEFGNVQFRALDVWRNNQPVMILSADAHFPAGAGAVAETYSITLVSRTDIYGSLRKLYAGVTDRFHLDVTPRLELIDGVDADGDGRGELLFRETSDAGKGYIIYRPTGDNLFKMFDSLGAE